MESNFNLGMLLNIFNMAVDVDAKYVAVLVQMNGFKEDEIIINPIANALDKAKYYADVYDAELIHKHSNGIRIIGATFGDSFEAVEYELLGD